MPSIRRVGRRLALCDGSNRRLKQLTAQWQQVHPRHRSSAFNALRVYRANHHTLTPCLPKDFDDTILISRKCAAHRFALNAHAKGRRDHRYVTAIYEAVIIAGPRPSGNSIHLVVPNSHTLMRMMAE